MEKYQIQRVRRSREEGLRRRDRADSSGAAHLALLERGYQTIEVSQKKSVLQFEITKKMVPRKDIMHFSRQLAVFVRAGVSDHGGPGGDRGRDDRQAAADGASTT